MAINPTSGAGLDAVRAYTQAARAVARSPQEEGGAQAVGGFGDLVRTALTQAEKAGKAAEGAMVAQATGRGDLVDVVTAVAAAEATLETVVAVRDQVIQAYQDILRMPI
jgi:flagellar hook-basal body complex protein FliE